MEKCVKDCVEHELAKIWYGITGDSWVVDCRPVWSASGAASYLFKYLDKGFTERGDLEALGFKRRWSCSRDWPSPERMEFVVTQSKGWQSTQFFKRGTGFDGQLQREEEASKQSPYAMKAGTELAVKTEKLMKVKRVQAMRGRYGIA